MMFRPSKAVGTPCSRMLRPSSAVSASSIQSRRASSEMKMRSVLTRTTATAAAVAASAALRVVRSAETPVTDGRGQADAIKRARGMCGPGGLYERERGTEERRSTFQERGRRELGAGTGREAEHAHGQNSAGGGERGAAERSDDHPKPDDLVDQPGETRQEE